MEYIAGELNDGRFLVRILRGGTEQKSDTFTGASAGVAWAVEIERELLDDGWTRSPGGTDNSERR